MAIRIQFATPIYFDFLEQMTVITVSYGFRAANAANASGKRIRNLTDGRWIRYGVNLTIYMTSFWGGAIEAKSLFLTHVLLGYIAPAKPDTGRLMCALSVSRNFHRLLRSTPRLRGFKTIS